MSKSQAVQTEAVRSPVPPEAAPTPPPPISMHHLSELKQHHVTQLVEMAVANGIEGANRMRKQDLIFAMLKNTAKKGESIFGDGTLEVLPDGFGFLRSPETSYLASAGSRSRQAALRACRRRRSTRPSSPCSSAWRRSGPACASGWRLRCRLPRPSRPAG